MIKETSLLFRSGDLFFTRRIRNFLETFIYGSYDQSIYVTYWSIMHFISGIICYLILRKYNGVWLKMFVIHSIWEIWQIFIGMSKPLTVVGHNNIFDTILDTIFFMIGGIVIHFLLK